MFGNAFVPLFILIFFILVFILYMWYDKNEREKKKREPTTPKYSVPSTENATEGFQGSTGSALAAAQAAAGGSANYNAAVSTSGSVDSAYGYGSNLLNSGSRRYKSQFDYYNTSSGSSKAYGTWETTAQDSFYDLYENNEAYAKYYMAQKMKDILPVKQPIPDYGGKLGTFDSDNIKIPWDSDNSSYNQSDIVWGIISEQASRSIYLKTWIQNLLANANEMEQCSESNSVNYCYRSPLFQVTVTDPAVTNGIKVAESIVSFVGSYVQSYGDDIIRKFYSKPTGAIGADGNPVVRRMTFSEMFAKNRSIFGVNRVTSLMNNGLTYAQNSWSSARVATVSAQIGPHLEAAGQRQAGNLAKKLKVRRFAYLRAAASNMKAAFAKHAGTIVSVTQATAFALRAAAVAAGASVIGAAAAIALTIAAAVATGVASFCLFLFGYFSIFIMVLETLLTPIVNALFHPGGVCPPGTKRLSELIPEAAMFVIASFIPMGSFLQTFDPFVCWNNSGAHLMKPPRIPSFMADNTLSLVYHAAWMGGKIPGVTTTNRELNIISDPLPPNYKWIPESDLATNPNFNKILDWAKGSAASGSFSDRSILSTIGSGGSASAFAKYIAVQTCPSGTTPSEDGFECVSATYNTDVKQPFLTPCATGEADDGQNCWKSYYGNCTGGISFEQTNSWNDTYGFFRLAGSAKVCDGRGGSSSNDITQTFYQRSQCQPGYEKDNGGILCFAKCKDGYTRIGAICQGGAAIKREFMWGTHSMYYDQEIDNENMRTLDDVKIPYCDFSSPVMLDRMAQFYYNNSINNPTLNEDGTITIQMITGFSGVVASSELSCDVACVIRFITYDPITGGKYKSATDGCTKNYVGDPYFEGCPFCYRRFYFIRGEQDKQGEFTVTACTFTDYTAPDAMVYTGDMSSNVIQSLPKTWKDSSDPSKRSGIVYKDATIVDRAALDREMRNGNVWEEAGINMFMVAITMGPMLAGGAIGRRLGNQLAGVVAGNTVGIGATIASPWINQGLIAAAGGAVGLDGVYNTTEKVVYGQGNNLSVATNSQYYTINHGPIYEIAKGYAPTIDFCQTSIIGIDHCTHKYVVRDMVNKYHNENRLKHIHSITDIEPRGKRGCYYKFKEVDYDPVRNLESEIEVDKELILQHEIKDYATCTYGPTTFTFNMNDPNYSIRSYIEPATLRSSTPRIIYPTRDMVYTSDLTARFVRVRPPVAGGDGFLNLAQLAVFDISGINISIEKRTYATSTFSGAMPAKELVNGTLDASGATLASIWQQGTANRNTEYFEIDLSQNMVISELVYFGGTIRAGRNKGVRIEFLYSNGATETPVYTITLPNDNTVQYLPVYSSMYTTPSYPMAGPIKIPRPVVNGGALGKEVGCINRCEDRSIIDTLITQYNESSPNTEIVKVVNGITTSSSTCEYQTEMLVNDIAAGSSKGKSSMVNQFVSMQLSPPVVTSVAGNIFARYVKITPSFTPGTVLEISKLLVWNTNTNTQNVKTAGYNVAYIDPASVRNSVSKDNAKVNYYNEIYELNELPPPPPPEVDVTDGGNIAQEYPRIFRAADNDPDTHFTVDLLGNNEIFQIQFVGRKDRMLGGIKGIKIELFKDMGTEMGSSYNRIKCCDGTYPPVYTYTLPTDDETQLFRVYPPAQCSFTLSSSTLLAKPVYLQDNVAPLSARDTSGGVLTLSNVLSKLGSTWNTITSTQAQDLTTPVVENVKESNTIVRGMLETLSKTKTIGTTGKRCYDTDVMSMMMTRYNIARGPKDTDQYGVAKYTMNRILKAGQATGNQCDVLFEELYNIYDDYIKDVTNPENKGKRIRAVRFTMGADGLPVGDAVGAAQKNIVDISANALGIVSDSSALDRPFTGPTYAVDCRNPLYLSVIKSMLEQGTQPYKEYISRSSFKTVKDTFQSTPLSCEYIMSKDILLTSPRSSYSMPLPNFTTYVKAVFSMNPDGGMALQTVKEYPPEDITFSSDYMKSYLKEVEVDLPSIYSYDPSKAVSTRVNSTPITL
jgi:hypothetical protein